MSMASKWLRALKASPLSLTYALLMCGLWAMALPLAATALNRFNAAALAHQLPREGEAKYFVDYFEIMEPK